ncbi:hypothetical protein BDF14DRAFT_476861 [Spinellus fusiger]|nr:hypothetical protein BDF14DRAFT_476861 [Spinellus fusiger]
MSRRKDYVCLWDSLLPPAKAQVCSLGGHDGGSYAVAFSANSHYLFSGGHRGGIVVSDIRQRTLLHTFSAHQSRIRSIAIDTENNLLITGSVDGELKVNITGHPIKCVGHSLSLITIVIIYNYYL